MARLQELTQLHALERASGPTPSRMLSGLSGESEGVPRMHPLKSSNPVFKAGSLIHGLRIKKFKMPGMRMPGLRMPRV